MALDPMEQRLVDSIDDHGIVTLAQGLVRIDTVSDPSIGPFEADAANVVEEVLRSLGWEVEVDLVAPGRPNVIAVAASGRPGSTLLFEGHTDVVTPGDRATWERDPFSGEIVDGRLHGRGSADMKAGLAAMIYAADAIRRSPYFCGTIMVAALVDEERLMLGAKHFVASGRSRGVTSAIICEPEGGEVCTVQKGALRLEVLATGRMAHGAMPAMGANPLTALTAYIDVLRALESSLASRYEEDPLLGPIYLTPTYLLGGSASQANVIPECATLGVDIRTTPSIDHEGLLAELRDGAASISETTGVILSLSVRDDRPPTSTDRGHPLVQSIVTAHVDLLGEVPFYGGVPGTTDGTILSRDGGIPVVIYGPGGKWIAHQRDEFVEIDDVLRHAGVYAVAGARYLSQGGLRVE